MIADSNLGPTHGAGNQLAHGGVSRSNIRLDRAQAAGLPVERSVSQLVESSGCIWACSEQPADPITESASRRAAEHRTPCQNDDRRRHDPPTHNGTYGARSTGQAGPRVQTRPSWHRTRRSGLIDRVDGFVVAGVPAKDRSASSRGGVAHGLMPGHPIEPAKMPSVLALSATEVAVTPPRT